MLTTTIYDTFWSLRKNIEWKGWEIDISKKNIKKILKHAKPF